MRILAGDHIFEFRSKDVIGIIPLEVPDGLHFSNGKPSRLRLVADARIRKVSIVRAYEHLSGVGLLPFALAARQHDAVVQAAPNYAKLEHAFLQANCLL